MSARRVGPDFYLVGLTDAGIALAKGSPLRISNGRISVVFPSDGEPVKIARYEWDLLLRDYTHISGKTLVRIFVEQVHETAADHSAAAAAEAKENE